TILKNHRNQFILSFQFAHPWELNVKSLQTALQHMPDLAGILVKTPETHLSLGDPYCEEKLAGLTFRYSPETFSQNHPEQSQNLYQQLCQLAAQTPSHTILDLYCGFGMTSLLLARQGHSVTGI